MKVARSGAAIGLLMVMTLLTGCGGRGLRGSSAGGMVTVEVDNQNYLDVVVLGLRDGSAARLGTVSGLMSSALDVPDHVIVVGSLRLLVDPIGSPEAYLTDPIPVSPGDVVELRVSSVVRMSSWSVRSGRREGGS